MTAAQPGSEHLLPPQIGPYRNRILGLRVMPVGELADHPHNWRKHPPAQAAGLDAVMRQIGVIDVVRFNEPTGRLWDGHLRKKLFGADPDTPVLVLVTDLDADEEAVALATFDPLAGMAQADGALLLALLRSVQDVPFVEADDDLQEILRQVGRAHGVSLDQVGETGADPGAPVERAAELRAQWGTARGQVWEIPSLSLPGRVHRLLCGDSTDAGDVARLMQGERADLISADPPYGIRLLDRRGSVGLSKPYTPIAGDEDGGTARRLYSVWSLVSACQVWWGANHYADALPPSAGWLVWDKDHHGMSFADAELAWTNRQVPARVFRHAWSGADRDSERGEERLHVNQKPVALFRWYFELLTERGAVVADPCVGSGPAFVAAEQSGRCCYGLEIEPAYVAVTLERLAGMGLTPRLAEDA